MTTPAFGPNHHPILDLPPHEFVRRANGAGIKLAKGVGFFDHEKRCGCYAGVAAFLVDPSYTVTSTMIGLDNSEFTGVVNGFDGTDYGNPIEGCYTTRKAFNTAKEQYALGLSRGSAVRAAALEIQGDLEPGTLNIAATAKGAVSQ